MPKKIGRPAKYTDELAKTICTRLAEGESLRTICLDEEIPSRETVRKWLVDSPSFLAQYARAREEQADFYAEEIVEISDDGRRDYTTTEDGREVVDHDHIARARLRVDARKWYASKLAPKKYGDKVTAEHSGPGGGPIETTSRIELVPIEPDSKG
jgi:hypothetical protein